MACLTPFYVDNPAYPHASSDRQVPVPCGRCPNCLKRRVSGWSFRLLYELRSHLTASFVTLTYDNDHVPVSENGFMTLRRSDLTNFFKRLRKFYVPGHIKYYAAGEYGSHTFRPHYHIILFGALDGDVHSCWTAGHVHIGTVSPSSIAYTLKYINKGRIVPVHRRDDRLPEYSVMSKKLGVNFLTPAVRSYYLTHPLECFLRLPGGYIIAMPRYYKDRIFDEFDKVRQAVDQRYRLKEIQRAAEDAYVQEFGSLDGFDEMNNARRLACFVNFKRNLVSRGF